jgi:hypothetical protein
MVYRLFDQPAINHSGNQLKQTSQPTVKLAESTIISSLVVARINKVSSPINEIYQPNNHSINQVNYKSQPTESINR